MHLKFLSIAFLFLMAAFISCDQSDDPEITQPIPRIKEITYYTNDTITKKEHFEYDQQGRLIKTSDSDGYIETYTYQQGKIIDEAYYPIYNSTVAVTLILNSRQLMASIVESDNHFVYDAQGYKISETGMYALKCTIEDGNTVRYESYDTEKNPPELLYIYQLNFLKDKPYTIGYENKGITFFGKQNKNPINNMMYHDPKRALDILVTYQYEYDANNRIVKSSRSDITNAYTTYSYME